MYDHSYFDNDNIMIFYFIFKFLNIHTNKYTIFYNGKIYVSIVSVYILEIISKK